MFYTSRKPVLVRQAMMTCTLATAGDSHMKMGCFVLACLQGQPPLTSGLSPLAVSSVAEVMSIVENRETMCS